MELRLHANATTTPRTRAYIQASTASVAALAKELGISERTVRRWKSRTDTADRSHTPHKLAIALTPVEEEIVRELRTRLGLSLDDITEVIRRCVNANISRDAVYSSLRRAGLNGRKKPERPAPQAFETATVGFIHIDLKYLPALEKRKSYVFVAIDRATRYVYVEIHPKRDGNTAAAFLERFLEHFPHKVHTILTDNGSEFTDRFKAARWRKNQKPTGWHPFDRICRRHKIEHRLARPYRPQTNGMVERFNRRMAEAIGREPKRGADRRLFLSHADRDAFIHRFVHDYNRTRLRCLDYQSPLQCLANQPQHNTHAGIHLRACTYLRNGFPLSRE
jgi:transposase InsO family protein